MMNKSQSPNSQPSESPKNFDHPISKESLERHLAALDAISNAVVGNSSNNTSDNIGFRSNSSFLIEDILFPRPKVRKWKTFRSVLAPSKMSLGVQRPRNWFKPNLTSPYAFTFSPHLRGLPHNTPLVSLAVTFLNN